MLCVGKIWIHLMLKIISSSCNAFAGDKKYYLSPQDKRKKTARSKELDCFSYKYRGIVAFKPATDTGIFSKP